MTVGTTDPLVSVIMPLYNCERYVGEALSSILEQTYKRTEIIVIDDGSKDAGAARVKDFGDKIRYEYQANAGIGSAHNRGFELATGSYIGFLDSDDLWTPSKLELQLTAMKADMHLDAVFGRVKQFHSPDLNEKQKSRIICPPETMPGYSASAMLIKREALLTVGRFDTKTKVGEFIDWFARAKEQNLKMQMLPDLVLKRRLHGDNTSMHHQRGGADFTKILKASIDRRRNQPQ